MSEVNSAGLGLSYMFISLNDPKIQRIAHHPFLEKQKENPLWQWTNEKATMTELRARPERDRGCRKAVN